MRYQLLPGLAMTALVLLVAGPSCTQSSDEGVEDASMDADGAVDASAEVDASAKSCGKLICAESEYCHCVNPDVCCPIGTLCYACPSNDAAADGYVE